MLSFRTPAQRACQGSSSKNEPQTRAGEGVDTNLSNIIETNAQREPATVALT